MNIVIKINMDTAAFEDAGGIEVSRILRKVSEHFLSWSGQGKFSMNLRDINGNKVGTAEVEP